VDRRRAVRRFGRRDRLPHRRGPLVARWAGSCSSAGGTDLERSGADHLRLVGWELELAAVGVGLFAVGELGPVVGGFGRPYPGGVAGPVRVRLAEPVDVIVRASKLLGATASVRVRVAVGVTIRVAVAEQVGISVAIGVAEQVAVAFAVAVVCFALALALVYLALALALALALVYLALALALALVVVLVLVLGPGRAVAVVCFALVLGPGRAVAVAVVCFALVGYFLLAVGGLRFALIGSLFAGRELQRVDGFGLSSSSG
jgi:hypothetical protein